MQLIEKKRERYLLLCNFPFYQDNILGNDTCYYTTVLLFLIFYRVYYYYYYYLRASTNGGQKWEGNKVLYPRKNYNTDLD